MERQAVGLKLDLGERAPYFSLRGTDGKIHSLSDFTGGLGFVVIFTCNHCPYAQAYESRILNLARHYQPLGIRFVAVCSNDPDGFPEDGFERMIEKNEMWGQIFPYLQDEMQLAAKAYDAACTPEAFVFDSQQKLLYHGRVDDNYEDPNSVNSADLKNALEALLTGRIPPIQLTPVLGCSIKWKR
jgi:peroxiredoxin